MPAQPPQTLQSNFNIFRALRLEGHEIRHSNFLGWLLDPTESHGQGELFLRAFFVAVVRGPLGLQATSLSGVDVDVFGEVQVSREVNQLDLRIVLPGLQIVVAIENKLFTSEHSEQLTRYADAVSRDYPGWRHSLLYLTIDGEPATHAQWRAISHRQVVAAISEAHSKMSPQCPVAIRAFVQHYLDLFADIYARREQTTRSHRVPEVIDTISAAVAEHPGWTLVETASSGIVECGPTSLFEMLPPIGTKRGRSPREWLTLRFHDHGAQGYVGRYWRPTETSDVTVRNAVLQALVENGQETGFFYKAGSLDDALRGRTPAFSGDRIQDLRTSKIPEPAVLSQLICRELTAIDARLAHIVKTVRTVLLHG